MADVVWKTTGIGNVSLKPKDYEVNFCVDAVFRAVAFEGTEHDEVYGEVQYEDLGWLKMWKSWVAIRVL